MHSPFCIHASLHRGNPSACPKDFSILFPPCTLSLFRPQKKPPSIEFFRSPAPSAPVLRNYKNPIFFFFSVVLFSSHPPHHLAHSHPSLPLLVSLQMCSFPLLRQKPQLPYPPPNLTPHTSPRRDKYPQINFVFLRLPLPSAMHGSHSFPPNMDPGPPGRTYSPPLIN